jgi:hypothetical protein
MSEITIPKDGQYHHLGGGTNLTGTPGHRPAYPSDDHWQRADGAEIHAVSTSAAHCRMPRVITSGDDLRWIKGLGKYVTIRAGASAQLRAMAHAQLKAAAQGAEPSAVGRQPSAPDATRAAPAPRA